MGLSCNQCHNESVGSNLRAEKISQGQINGSKLSLKMV